MLTQSQSRTLAKGYVAVLNRERDRHRTEYVETSTLTVQFQIAGNEAYFRNLICQLVKPYAGFHGVQFITEDSEPVLERSSGYLTVDQAARSTGYSIHQITRWLRDGHWQGSKVDGHWHIDLDSSFSRPPRKSRHH